jgi:DNA mismatch repair ATPase MutS
MEINNLLLGDVTYQERSAVEALLSYIQHIREPARGNVVTSPIVPKTMLQGFDSPIQIMPAIRRFETHRFMRMDVSTRRALELHRSWRDPSSKQGSLLAAIDATVTASGSRLLSMRLACPLMDPEAIDSRLDAVEFFLRHRAIARELRRGLQNVMDIERTTQRIALSCRVTHDEHVSRPVDGHSLRHPHDNTVTPFASSQMQNQIRDLIALGETLGRALHIRDFIWKKHAAALDQKDRCVQAVQRQMERICCDRVFSILTAAFVDISGPLPTLMSTTQQPTSESTSRPGESVASTDSINFHSSSQASEHHSMLNSSMPRRQLGAIRPGFSAELDAARTEWEHTESSMNELEQLYRRLFGLRTLRVRNNNLVGWYLEVTRRDASRHAVFRQAQIHGKWEQFAPILSAAGDTKFAAVDASAIVSKMGYNLTEDAIKRLGETRNTARFRTRLLEHQEAHRLRAESRFIQAQLAVLSELSQRCAVEPVARDCIRETSAALSELDVAAGLAQVAHEHHYCRPILHRVDAEKPRCLIRIVNGRHPTVERSVQNFVPNSCYLEISNGEEPSSPSMLLLTSANASGKSTYLRQVALITILAQIGSFVPADFCELHPADGVYARVGAASGDDLVSARSTFFVEMEETAAILRQATRQSLVVLDEVGRGTSSEDGTAIGEAVATALAPRCRTLFATHYHEISRRIQNPSHPVSKYTQCVTTRVERDPETGALTFSYRLCDGVASSSFGIEVARLAGLPEPVLRQAESIVKSNKTQALGVRSTG